MLKFLKVPLFRVMMCILPVVNGVIILPIDLVLTLHDSFIHGKIKCTEPGKQVVTEPLIVVD